MDSILNGKDLEGVAAKDVLYGTVSGSHVEILRDSVSLIRYVIMNLHGIE